MTCAWTWDEVTTDCMGVPEEVVYVLAQALVEIKGWFLRCFSAPETGEEVCFDEVEYWPAVPVRTDETAGTRWPDADVYIPPLGGVTFIDVEARDEAGNVSGGICE